MHSEQLKNLNVIINNVQRNISNVQAKIAEYNTQLNNLINQQLAYNASLDGLSNKLSEAQSDYDNAVKAKNVININSYKQQVYHAATYTTTKLCKGHTNGDQNQHSSFSGNTITVSGNVTIGGTRDSITDGLQKQVNSREIKNFNIVFIRPVQLGSFGNALEYGYRYTHHDNDTKCNDYNNSSNISSSAYCSSEVTSESHRQYNEAIANADKKIIECNQIKLNIVQEETELRAKNEQNTLKFRIDELTNLISRDKASITQHEKELASLDKEKISLKTKLEEMQKQNVEILDILDKVKSNTIEIKGEKINPDIDDCTVTNSMISKQDLAERNEEMSNMGDINDDGFANLDI